MNYIRKCLKRAYLSWKAGKPNAPLSLREALQTVEAVINKTAIARLDGNAPKF